LPLCARRFRNALLFIAVENNREGGARVARAAWSHVLFSVEREIAPAAVYDKASARG
jgi:hypothetical protein